MALKSSISKTVSHPLKPHESLTPHRIGKLAEEIAAEYLEGVGHSVLFRNWRTRTGEIDIITQVGTTIVIAEVKVRALGSPFHVYASVDKNKQQQLYSLAQDFCRLHRSLVKNLSVRFDVIRLTYAQQEGELCFSLEHIERAIGHAQTNSSFETGGVSRGNNRFGKKPFLALRSVVPSRAPKGSRRASCNVPRHHLKKRPPFGTGSTS